MPNFDFRFLRRLFDRREPELHTVPMNHLHDPIDPPPLKRQLSDMIDPLPSGRTLSQVRRDAARRRWTNPAPDASAPADPSPGLTSMAEVNARAAATWGGDEPKRDIAAEIAAGFHALADARRKIDQTCGVPRTLIEGACADHRTESACMHRPTHGGYPTEPVPHQIDPATGKFEIVKERFTGAVSLGRLPAGVIFVHHEGQDPFFTHPSELTDVRAEILRQRVEYGRRHGIIPGLRVGGVVIEEARPYQRDRVLQTRSGTTFVDREITPPLDLRRRTDHQAIALRALYDAVVDATEHDAAEDSGCSICKALYEAKKALR